MNPLRSVLLAGSQSEWLRRRATSGPLARRAVSRFMPGERLEDALAAGAALAPHGLGIVVTHLGENVATEAEAAAVTRHYLEALRQIQASGLDCEVSVKLTQLGLDLGVERALQNADMIAVQSGALGRRLWVDMEASPYVDRTLEIYKALRAGHPRVGLCLQSYLRRTRGDLESLIPLGAAVRLVKGAYAEPAELAFPAKKDVDENYYRLAERLLDPAARDAGAWLTAGTHDPVLISRIRQLATARGVPGDELEFTLLYGIRREAQMRLAADGFRTRVLISYGSYWFPWYMRRLAERPANLLFVLKSMLGATS